MHNGLLPHVTNEKRPSLAIKQLVAAAPQLLLARRAASEGCVTVHGLLEDHSLKQADLGFSSLQECHPFLLQQV